MAGSREYWWERYTKRLNPSRWVRGIVKHASPKPERRRGSREFDRDKEPSRTGPGRPGPVRDPYRDIWNDAGGQGSFGREKAFFQALPVQYESRQEELDIWESFVRNMTHDTGLRYNDPGNPFWSDLGMNPRNFDWAGWRAAVWGGRHRTL